MKTGALVHVYHLETVGWEDLMWGVPDEDRLGSLPMLVWLLLTEPADTPITTVTIGCGPSVKAGLSESEYSKKFLLDRFDRLSEFPRLAPLLKQLSHQERMALRERLKAIMPMEEIRGTIEEVAAAARMFSETKADRDIQIAAATHAPRCLQQQAMARLKGLIPSHQQWFVMPTDMCFLGTVPDETVVIEPPHRADRALTHARPTLAELLKPTVYMPDDDKRALIALVKDFLDRRQIND